LLPALPDVWVEGSVKGLCARGGFEVSMDWSKGQLAKVEVLAKKGGKASLVCNEIERVVELNAGEQIAFDW
jgi:alpha-L-fucosidase 2